MLSWLYCVTNAYVVVGFGGCRVLVCTLSAVASFQTVLSKMSQTPGLMRSFDPVLVKLIHDAE